MVDIISNVLSSNGEQVTPSIYFKGKEVTPGQDLLKKLGVVPNTKLMCLVGGGGCGSKILEKGDFKLIKSWANMPNLKLQLLYRATEHGWG